MNDHSEHEDAFEKNVRASFRRHLAGLERSVPASPPGVAWSDRDALRGRVHEREVRWVGPRRDRSTVWQLATALTAVAAVAAVAVVANLALRAVQSGPGAASGVPGPAPMVLERFGIASLGDHELTALAPGFGGAAYVIDSTSGSVELVDLGTGEALSVAVKGQPVLGGGVVATPRLLASDGCLLVMDESNQIWKWCTPSGLGPGSLDRVYFAPSNTSREISAFAAWPAPDLESGNDLMSHVLTVEPQRRQLVEHPLSEGSATASTDYLAEPRDLSGVEAVCVQGGAVFLLDGGSVVRFADGRESDWQPKVPATATRPYYSLISPGYSSDSGHIFLYDSANRQLVAVNAVDGAFVHRYQVGGDGWAGEPKGMFVAMGPSQSDRYSNVPTVYWIASGRLFGAALPVEKPYVTPPPTPTPPPTATPPTEEPYVTPPPTPTPPPTATPPPSA